MYAPNKNIYVYKSLIPFTCRLAIKHYIPSKQVKYREKLYKLCDRATEYTYNFWVYEGKSSQLEPPGCPTYIGSNGKIVWNLISPLFNQGYHLYMDNFDTSLPLFHHLYLKKTLACGTVRAIWKGSSQRLVTTKFWLWNGEICEVCLCFPLYTMTPQWKPLEDMVWSRILIAYMTTIGLSGISCSRCSFPCNRCLFFWTCTESRA